MPASARAAISVATIIHPRIVHPSNLTSNNMKCPTITTTTIHILPENSPLIYEMVLILVRFKLAVMKMERVMSTSVNMTKVQLKFPEVCHAVHDPA